MANGDGRRGAAINRKCSFDYRKFACLSGKSERAGLVRTRKAMVGLGGDGEEASNAGPCLGGSSEAAACRGLSRGACHD